MLELMEAETLLEMLRILCPRGLIPLKPKSSG